MEEVFGKEYQNIFDYFGLPKNTTSGQTIEKPSNEKGGNVSEKLSDDNIINVLSFFKSKDFEENINSIFLEKSNVDEKPLTYLQYISDSIKSLTLEVNALLLEKIKPEENKKLLHEIFKKLIKDKNIYDIEAFDKEIFDAITTLEKMGNYNGSIHRAFLVKKFVNSLLLGKSIDISLKKNIALLYEIDSNSSFADAKGEAYLEGKAVHRLKEDLEKMKK